MKTAMSFAPYVTFVLVLAAGVYHQWFLAVLFLGSAIIWVGDVFEGICRTLDKELQARDDRIAELQRRLKILENSHTQRTYAYIEED
jgi:hypothetical protein